MATRSTPAKLAENTGSITDKEKLAIDEERWEAERHTNVMLSGIKGLAVLNGAGVAAMLAFTQALLAKPEVWMRFKPFGVGALVCFFFGAVAASWLFYPFARAIADPKNRLRYEAVGSQFLGVAMTCSIVGAALSVMGIWTSL